MSSIQTALSPADYMNHTPVFNEAANILAHYFSSINTSELATRLSISLPLAVKASLLFYDFPNKTTGTPALYSFTGEVFKALSPAGLSDKAKEFATTHLRIVSSLYGLLSPTDFIKPYRLDFKVNLYPLADNLIKYWRPKITDTLTKYLNDSKENEILDLLPIDASKYIDWDVIKRYADVRRVNFKMRSESGNLKTPSSRLLKEMRGLLTKELLEKEIKKFSEILELSDNSPFTAKPSSNKDFLFLI